MEWVWVSVLWWRAWQRQSIADPVEIPKSNKWGEVWVETRAQTKATSKGSTLGHRGQEKALLDS